MWYDPNLMVEVCGTKIPLKVRIFL
jgi:hypothetical protein